MTYMYTVDKNGKVTKNTNTTTNTTKKKKKQTVQPVQIHYTVDENGKVTKNNIEDIAPVKKTTTSKSNSKKKNDKWYDGYLQKGALSDGYQFGDITKTLLATDMDIRENFVSGALGVGEKAIDTGAYVVGGIAGLFGADEFKKKTEEFMEKDLIDEKKIAKKIVSQGKDPISMVFNPNGSAVNAKTQYASVLNKIINGGEDNSVLGDKTDSLIQSGGQLATTSALSYLKIPWWLTTGVSSFGEQAETALKEGATYGQAGGSALISAGAEVLFEKLGGGIKFGGKTLDDVMLRPLTEKISNKLLRTTINLGLDATGEGMEEVFTSLVSRAGTSLYKEENIDELLTSEEAMDEYIDSFVGGALLGGVAGAGRVMGNNIDAYTHKSYTETEQKVIDKEFENRIKEAEEKGKTLTKKEKTELYNKVLNDLNKGGISIDTIESALGDKTYETYKNLQEQEDTLKKERDLLNYIYKDQISIKPNERLKQIDAQIGQLNTAQIKEQLSNEVSELAKDSRLVESYNEKARRSQPFTADLTKYDVKQQETVKRAIDSGILNNTNRTHELVDLIAKISADKGVLFDFTNNQKIKESGFAVEGKTVNGYVTEDGNIGINIESSKSLNRIVGHEITHVLEGTELYAELQKAVKQYATTKGEYDTRIKEMTKLYTDKNGKLRKGANIENEVTADLVGDYLFADDDFINNLSTEQPNIFKKIYDEIKYLCKVATAGSKEARQLEKVKRAFEKAYNQTASKNTDTKYSFSGTRAKTADSSLFLKADRMLDKGFDSETVRQETGWFKGYDGKMRFEIDDSQMKVYPNGDLKYRKAHPEYVELEELKKKQAKSELTEEELARLNKLDNIWGNEANRWNELLRSGNLQLENILEHDKLYASYPELKDIDIKIASSESGYLGEYNASKNSITINEKLLEGDTTEVKKTLIHEIQHAIQHIEGFTTGSSREYWQDKIDDGYLIKTNEQNTELQKLKKEYEDISKAEPELVREINELEESTPTVSRGAFDFETFEQIEDDPIEWQIFDKKRELLEQKYGDEKVSKLMYLNYKIENLETKGMTASDAYYKTAGEIEARDTASRLSLNEEQRKATRPSIDREDVVFSDNTNPTSNDDVRFSLSEPVEQAKDLVAIHNLNSDKLLSIMELGGFPMPSVAITKDTASHEGYGDISVVLKPNAIDPESNSDNKVFSADAYTPTFPATAYKLDTAELRKLAEKLDTSVAMLEANEFRNGNLSDILYNFTQNKSAKELFAKEKGYTVEPVLRPRKLNDKYLERVQEFVLSDEFSFDKLVNDLSYREQYFDKIKENSKNYGKIAFVTRTVDKYINDTNEMLDIASTEKNLAEALNNQYMTDIEQLKGKETLVEDAYSYIEGLNNLINEKSDEFNTFVKDLIEPVLSDKYLRNNKNYYTESGNPRPFESLHEEYNAENAVKIMRENSDTNAVNSMFGVSLGELKAVLSKNYSTIDEIHKDKAKISEDFNEEIQAKHEECRSKFFDITKQLAETSTLDDSFMARDNAGRTILEALGKSKQAKGIYNYINKNYTGSITMELAKDIENLAKDIMELPVHYFESKPQRVVGFDEVGAVVLPYNADAKLKQQLLNNGLSIAEYNPDVEGDRKRVVNQFEDYKFSLSNREQITAPYGKYDVYGKDVALETPVQEQVQEVAPVQETIQEPVSKMETSTEDYAPLPEEQANESDVEQSFTSMESEDTEKAVESYDTEKVVESYMDDAPVEESIEKILYSLEETKNKELSDIDTKVEEAENAEEPELTVNESYNARLENYNNAIEGYKTARTEIETAFDEAIEKKSKEYEALKRKDTKKASDILMKIENLKLRKANNLSNIDSRIDKTQTSVDNMIKNADSIKQGMYGRRRKALHTNIMNGIKETFATKGFDFDKVLKKAKNKSTFASVDNTPQRFMEKTLGYQEGQTLADITVNKVAQNESAGIKWVNENVSLLKQISKEYGIKPRSKESASAQMYAEGFYADENGDLVAYGDKELKEDFGDPRVIENIKKLAKDARIRSIYDETLDQINKSRTRNAYPEIPKRDNYFLHFIEMDDAFSRLGIPFNPNDIRAKDLPTDINGVTADLKPGQPYFASAMQRKGYKTTYDLLGGVEKYLNSAKNQIYHIDDIQTLRATRNYIADMFGQAKGLENLDTMTEAEANERIEQVFGSHLSNFAKFLHEEANVIAGKTALIDRGLEGIIGRRGISFLNTLNGQVGSNMVGFNVSSSLTNFISVMQSMAKSSKIDTLKAFTQTASNKIGSMFGRTDGFADTNPAIIRRKGIDTFARKPFEKISDTGYVLMSAIDDISTEIIVRTKFNELTRKGMSEEQAHIEADKWSHRILGDRSLGQQPLLYNSKMLGLITKFQLEVRNQLDSQFYDTIQEAKASTEEIDNAVARNAVKSAKIGSTMLQLAVLQHVFGKAFESVAGYNPAFDIIEVLMTTFGFDDEEDSEDTPLDNIEQGFLALLEDLPYSSVLTGGRIPISSALPITELVKGEDSYGQKKSRVETLKEVAPYYLLPTGYGQIKKTKQGLDMFSDEHPVSGSYTDSGNLRFPVEDTTKNRIQAGLFGQWANENARYYFDNDIAPLKEKQIQEYIDVDMPIKDYWKYRDEIKGKKKIEDKVDYISNMDIPIDKKNILINNATTRKESIDLTDYEEYSDFNEFDFASKYPEKYEFLQQNNISYEEYSKDKETKGAYTWAFKNPEEFTLSKAVSNDIVTYKSYTKDLYNIKADKDSNGKSISGSRKEKVLDYINNLDADYGEKIILFKSEYKADDTYNYEIIDYLNSREDITYDEMNTILKELGFTVKSDGTIYWD